MKKQIIFPTTLPERPKDGHGRSYGGNDGHCIVRVILNPPIEKGPQQSWDSALDEFENGIEIDLGEQIGVHNGKNRVGPFRLRVGKHPQFGLVALAIAAGEITVIAIFEMGHLKLAKPDIKAFIDSFENIDIVENA